jgi:hypothetical protein
MDAERTLSATAATAKAINKAIETIETTNNTNQATKLRIHNLEKQLIEQKQTANEILNHICKQKNKEGNRLTNLSIHSLNTRKRSEHTNKMVLTPNNHNKDQNIQQHKKRRILQWDKDSMTPIQINQNQTQTIPTQNLNPFNLALLHTSQNPAQTNFNLATLQSNQLSTPTNYNQNFNQHTKIDFQPNQTQIQTNFNQNINQNSNTFQTTPLQTNQTSSPLHPIPFQLIGPQTNPPHRNLNYKFNTPFTTHQPTPKLINQKY